MPHNETKSAPPEELRRALFIRRFEELLLTLFAEGKLNGTVHTCIGQELAAIAVAQVASSDDMIFSNHRGHGHYLAFHNKAEALLSEIMGRRTGLCGGAGGSQHLRDRNFYSNGVLGGMSPIGVGAAWAERLREGEGVAIVFHGDGALGEGVVYEAMNLAATWGLGVVWVVERNGYAQSTDCRTTFAGELAKRAAGFGLEYFSGNTWEFATLQQAAADALRHARTRRQPVLLEIATYRLAAHSKGDDNRDPAEIARFRARDPLAILEREWPEQFAQWDAAIQVELAAIVVRCEQAPFCDFTPAWTPHLAAGEVQWERAPEGGGGERYSAKLYQCFDRLLATTPEVVLLGEDIEGGYGGAFKVTRDLSIKYPRRVRNTPISEAAIVGAATGAALHGRKPIVEIMFGDFLSLVLDQLLQHACKFEMMYGSSVRVPVIVRTPMGGRRGYGPTHSQSIEAHFFGIPDLDIFALNYYVDPELVYGALVAESRRPALVIENKILYTRSLTLEAPAGFELQLTAEKYPTVRVTPAGVGTVDVTLVGYGGMMEIMEQAAAAVFESDEILCEIICPTRLVPLDISPIAWSVRRSKRVLVVEEGKTFAAFGSEVLARLAEAKVSCGARRLGYDHYIPSAAQREKELLPDVPAIVSAIRKLVYE